MFTIHKAEEIKSYAERKVVMVILQYLFIDENEIYLLKASQANCAQ